MRNTRGLPLDASYECTGMHNFCISSCSYLILHNITNERVTEPGGELLLGLPTLPTTHRMNAEENTSGKQPYALKQTYGKILNHSKRLMHCVSCMLSLSCFLQKEETDWRTA